MRKSSNYVHGSLAEKVDYINTHEYEQGGANIAKRGRRNAGLAARKNRVPRKDKYIRRKKNHQKRVELSEEERAELKAEVAEKQKILSKELDMRKVRRHIRVKYISMTLVLFVVFVALIYRYSMVIEINNTVLKSNAYLNEIKNTVNVTQKEINRETDIETVRLLAEERLNMQKPDSHQYIYIRVPRRDHALLNAEIASKTADMEKTGLKNRIDEILDRIWLD